MPVGSRVAALAVAQHGVVSLTQLVGLGLSASAVRSRVAHRSLHRVHQGVYAVGHPSLTREGRWLAAVLACGPGAALSHRSALALHGLRPSARGLVDVTVRAHPGRRRPGIDVHRMCLLEPRDIIEVRGIPCTTVARTLLDAASAIGPDALDRAIAQAEIIGILDLESVSELIGRSRGRRGVALLRSVVDHLQPEAGITRSRLEQRFLAMCRQHDLPAPAVNCHLEIDGEWIEVDFAWREQRLVVETDSRRYHATVRAFEADRRRDQRLALAGWQVIRATWRQLVEETEVLVTTIRRLLYAERRIPTK